MQMQANSKSFEFEKSTQEGHSSIFRSHILNNTQDLATVLPDGSTTIYEMLDKTIVKYGPNICFGNRRIIDVIEEVKEVEKKDGDGNIYKENKTWKYFHLSEYEWVTYQELGQHLTYLGSALKYLGIGKGDKLALYAPTSRYWSTLANSCYTQSIVSVTVYDTLGAEGLQHGLTQCEVPAVFIAPEQVKTLIKVLPSVPTLTTILYTNTLPDSDKEALLAIKSDLKIHSLEELLKLGQENEVPHNPPSADDTALIMYTSGTTGNPKGVVISHRNVVSVVAGIKHLVDDLLNPLEDVICSFLPLAHILAFAVDCYLLHYGVRIAYATPRTLTDTSVRKCKGDLRESCPTLLVGVPQIYDQIRKGILNKINSSGSLSQAIFGKSMWIKRQFSRAGVPTFLLDALVFNKVKEQLGGRLRWAVSGGAPLSEETRDFFSTAVCHLLQGYGLTEVCGLAFVNTPDINAKESIGQITPANEFKLVDVPDAGYKHTNNPPQGELWFRGGSVSKGYYKNEEATKEAFTEDGWFMSGDIVTMHPDGTLSVIDRKKNLVKLANGEYIALERLESYYRNCLYVQNICVCANSYKPKPVALVQVNLEALNHFAKANGMESFHDLEAASKSDAARKEVLKAMHAEGKKVKFNGSEMVADVYLTPKEWTSDNGLLTTSQKLKRKPIGDEFKEQLDNMYNKISG